jgi:ankyrin repeat protein
MMGLLLSAGAASGAEELSGALVQILQEQPVDIRLLKMVLEADADVNMHGGAALELAINDSDHTIVELLLRCGKPSTDLLRHGLYTLTKLPSTQSKVAKLKALLRRADLRPSSPSSPPYPVNPNFTVHLTPADLHDLLPAEVSAVLETSQEARSLLPLQLLLQSGADINANGGQALHIAIHAANEPITDLLFNAKPSAQALKGAMPYAVHIKSPMDRLAFTKRLLDAGTMPQEVNRALVYVVQAYPEDVALLKTLAEKADVSDPEALLLAIDKEDADLVELLLQYTKHPTTAIDDSLNRCMKLQNRTSRLEICRLLLRASPSNEVISSALPVAAGEGDFVLGKLLVEAGATLAEDGQAIIEASRSGSADMLGMMLASKSLPSPETLDKAFQAATEVGDLKKRGAVFEILLGKGAGGAVVNEQLVSAARYGEKGRELLGILVRAGADPNSNKGEAVCAAIRSAILENVEVLLGRVDVGREVVCLFLVFSFFRVLF